MNACEVRRRPVPAAVVGIGGLNHWIGFESDNVMRFR